MMGLDESPMTGEESIENVSDEYVLLNEEVQENTEDYNDFTGPKGSELYTNIVELSPFGIVTVNRRGVITSINEKAAAMLGYSSEDIIGKPFTKIGVFKKTDIIKYLKLFSSIIQGKKIEPFEDEFQRIDNTTFFAEVHLSTLKENNRIVGLQAVIIDTSERKKYENKLKKSERLYRGLYEAQVNGFAIFRSIFNEAGEFVSYEFIDINPAYEHITGVKREEVIGKDIQEVFPGTEQSWIDVYGSVALSGESKTFEMYHEPTRKYYYCNVFRPWDNNKRFCVAFNDITERTLSEMKLKESEEKYRTLFDTMAQGVVYQEANGEIISANPAAERILGLTLSQMQGRTSMDPQWKAVDKDKHELSGENHPAMIALKTGEKVTDFLQGVFNPEKNDYVWIIVNSVPQFKEGSETPYQVYSTFLDVTERVNAEIRLKETLNATTDGIWTWDFKTDTLFFSDRYYQMLGYQPQEFKATFDNWITLIHPDDREHALAVAKDYLKQKPDVYENNFRLKTKQGDYRWIRAKARVVQRDENGEAIRMIGNHEDITEQKKIEDELRHSEESYRTVFNSSTDTIFIHDYNTGKIIDVNQTTIDTFGYTKDEIVEMDVGDFSINEPPYTQKEAKAWIQKAAHEGPQRFEWLAKNKAGQLIWFENSLQLVQISGEQRILVVGRNITEKKKAEQALLAKEKRFRNLAELLPAAVVETDSNLQMTFANNHAFELMNYSQDDYKQGVNALDLFPPDEHERVKKNLAKRMAGAHLGTVEYQAVKKNGERFPVLVHAAPMMKDGVFQGLRAVIVDITKIKEYREKLESLNNQLEQRVAERTERIQQLLQQKDEFINQLGHDLKNPLGPLTQLLPLVEEHVDDPKYKNMLQVAIRNTRYMKQLVTKTIQLAQLKSPNTELNYESLDLCEEVSEIIETNQLMFEENQIKVQNNLAEKLMVHADKLKIHEVFSNLLNNAVKYTDKKPGCITIDSSMDDNKYITISIRDYGVGMTGEQLDRVFDEFYKADGSRHNFDSSGLGMPICKRIVEMHGGRIWAESGGLGNGSTFFFTLPTNIEKTFKKEEITA